MLPPPQSFKIFSFIVLRQTTRFCRKFFENAHLENEGGSHCYPQRAAFATPDYVRITIIKNLAGEIYTTENGVQIVSVLLVNYLIAIQLTTYKMN